MYVSENHANIPYPLRICGSRYKIQRIKTRCILNERNSISVSLLNAFLLNSMQLTLNMIERKKLHFESSLSFAHTEHQIISNMFNNIQNPLESASAIHNIHSLFNPFANRWLQTGMTYESNTGGWNSSQTCACVCSFTLRCVCIHGEFTHTQKILEEIDDTPLLIMIDTRNIHIFKLGAHEDICVYTCRQIVKGRRLGDKEKQRTEKNCSPS